MDEARESDTLLLIACTALLGAVVGKLEPALSKLSEKPTPPEEAKPQWTPGSGAPPRPRKAPTSIYDTDTARHATDLLADVRGIIGASGLKRITTCDLIDRLRKIHRWTDLPANKYQAAREIARLLRPFGIEAMQYSEHHRNHRGYSSRSFDSVL